MNIRPIVFIAAAAVLVIWARRATPAPLWQDSGELAFDETTGQMYTLPQEAPGIMDNIISTVTNVFTPNRPEDDSMAVIFAPDAPMPEDAAMVYERRLAAFMATIRDFEANGDYSVIYGGQTFSDFSKHPNIRVPFYNPRTKKQDYSTAAGAYQINYPTWRTEIQPALNLPDFSPQSQDIAARYLIERRTQAARYLASGDIAGAYRAAAPKWASLPGSDAQQNPKPMQTALDRFNQYYA